ncbi:MAG: hypothetical protein ABIO02_02910 [Patescibacteria group bacterium]
MGNDENFISGQINSEINAVVSSKKEKQIRSEFRARMLEGIGALENSRTILGNFCYTVGEPKSEDRCIFFPIPQEFHTIDPNYPSIRMIKKYHLLITNDGLRVAGYFTTAVKVDESDREVEGKTIAALHLENAFNYGKDGQLTLPHDRLYKNQGYFQSPQRSIVKLGILEVIEKNAFLDNPYEFTLRDDRLVVARLYDREGFSAKALEANLNAVPKKDAGSNLESSITVNFRTSVHDKVEEIVNLQNQEIERKL